MPSFTSPLDLARSYVSRSTPAETRDRMLAFCAAHPDALLRTCADGHLTGSTIVFHATDPLVLLMHHRKLDAWFQMGGHADGDGDLLAVATREAREESGIDGLLVHPDPVDLDIHRVAPPGEPPHLHLDVRFAARAPAGAVPSGNHESHELRWFRIDHIAEPGLRRLASAAVALLS